MCHAVEEPGAKRSSIHPSNNVTLPCMWLQVVVGNPPNPIMEDALMATPFGVVMAGKDSNTGPSLSEQEVKLAYSMGEWTAQVAKILHDDDS